MQWDNSVVSNATRFILSVMQTT